MRIERLVPDNRGQSIQIGAILMFAILIISFSTYQAFIVPNQNEEIEYQHSREVTDDMRQVRSAILNVGGTGTTQSETVKLGTQYPSRLLTMNPPPVSGTLRTAAQGQLEFNRSFNVSNSCGYTGTARSFVYDPNYNVYQQDPTIGYDNSVVYRNVSGGLIVDTEQTLIEDKTIQITPLNASFSTTSTETITLTFKGGPSNGTVQTTEAPLNLTMPTRIPADTWETNDKLFGNVDAVKSVRDADTPNAVNVTLKEDTYTLACRAVGIDGYPESGAATPAGINTGGYGSGNVDTYDPENPQAETLATKGGKLVGIINASHIALQDPSFTMTQASDAQISGTQKRYLQVGLKIQNASIGQGKYRRYFFVIGPKEGLEYKVDPGSTNNISWQNTKVSLYRDQTGGSNTELFSGKAISDSVADSWVVDGKKMDILAEENYESSGDVQTGLNEVQDFMNNSEETSLIVTDLHGRVVANVTDEVARPLGSYTASSSDVITFIGADNTDLKTIADDGASVSEYDTPNGDPGGIGQKGADLSGVTDDNNDIPYKGANNGNLRAVDDANTSTTLTTGAIKSHPMGVGDWDDDGNVEVLYVGNNNGKLRQYEPDSGTESIISGKNNHIGKGNDVQAIAGVGNFSGDSSNEVVFVQNNKVKYLTNGGNDPTKVSNTQIDDARSVSTIADFDGDTDPEIAVYDSNNDVGLELWDENGKEGSKFVPTWSNDPLASPMAASDVTGDNTPEIILLDGNDNELRYLDWTDQSSARIKDDNGNYVKADSNYGAR